MCRQREEKFNCEGHHEQSSCYNSSGKWDSARAKGDLLWSLQLHSQNELMKWWEYWTTIYITCPFPWKENYQNVHTEEGTNEEELLSVMLHRVLFAGDQLTVKRAQSTHAQWENSENAKDKLDGFVPVAQDWHAGMCFLEVRRLEKELLQNCFHL